jgi:hypothetical protein
MPHRSVSSDKRPSRQHLAGNRGSGRLTGHGEIGPFELRFGQLDHRRPYGWNLRVRGLRLLVRPRQYALDSCGQPLRIVEHDRRGRRIQSAARDVDRIGKTGAFGACREAHYRSCGETADQ